MERAPLRAPLILTSSPSLTLSVEWGHHVAHLIGSLQVLGGSVHWRTSACCPPHSQHPAPCYLLPSLRGLFAPTAHPQQKPANQVASPRGPQFPLLHLPLGAEVWEQPLRERGDKSKSLVLGIRVGCRVDVSFGGRVSDSPPQPTHQGSWERRRVGLRAALPRGQVLQVTPYLPVGQTMSPIVREAAGVDPGSLLPGMPQGLVAQTWGHGSQGRPCLSHPGSPHWAGLLRAE